MVGAKREGFSWGFGGLECYPPPKMGCFAKGNFTAIQGVWDKRGVLVLIETIKNCICIFREYYLLVFIERCVMILLLS